MHISSAVKNHLNIISTFISRYFQRFSFKLVRHVPPDIEKENNKTIYSDCKYDGVQARGSTDGWMKVRDGEMYV